jgi:hypothetical protein
VQCQTQKHDDCRMCCCNEGLNLERKGLSGIRFMIPTLHGIHALVHPFVVSILLRQQLIGDMFHLYEGLCEVWLYTCERAVSISDGCLYISLSFNARLVDDGH